MNWKSTAILGVVGGTVVTLLATASPSPDGRRHAVAAPPPIDHRQGAALIAQTEKLRARLRPQVVPSASTRNPFAFAPRTAAPRIAPPEPARSEAASSSSLDLGQPPLPFTLVGLAVDRSSGSMVVTAILSSPGSLQFVKQGDRVEGGYRVADITAESVELIGDDGRPLMLRLK
jgi:hypothetical protein